MALARLLIAFAAAVLAAAAMLPRAWAGACPSQCGGVDIPYPFGIGDGCALNSDFQLLCAGNKPFLVGEDVNYEIHSISVDNATLRISTVQPPICKRETYWNLWASYPTFNPSPSENVFTVVGCNVLGLLNTYALQRTVGCISTCPPAEKGWARLVEKGACNGVGCCQISIGPKPEDYLMTIKKIDSAEIRNVSDLRGECYRAFLVEKGRYVFDGVEERVDPAVNGTYPLVVDWSLGGRRTCADAQRNRTAYACRDVNSVCRDAPAWGYQCHCKEGFRGNPYLLDGCTDNPLGENTTCAEAQGNRTSYACRDVNSVCRDVPAWGYLCVCKNGFQGNPYLPNGCTDIDECQNGEAKCGDKVCVNLPGNYTCVVVGSRRSSIGVIIGVGSSVGGFLLIAAAALCYQRWQKQRRRRERQRHFRRNSNLLRKQLRVSSYEGESILKSVSFFSLKDLKKATANFDASHIVGQGGHGTVYKGLIDLRVVAIKKSNIVVEEEIKGFINEIILLSHVRHRNVVKLVGCCFETEVPLLAYEFVSNGTLAEHLHRRDRHAPLPWRDRLRIAAEIARSLSYLHSAANISIFHRDIKSSNILLDDKLTAKVSDFGASKLVDMDRTHVSTNIQGTFGYLDPEYMHTGQLTDKSDVYSLGVILIELITGKKPSSVLIDQELEGNMIIQFIWAVREGKLFDVVEASMIAEDGGAREEVELVAKLAVDCLSFRGKERPSMKEVEAALEGARKLRKGAKMEGGCAEH